VGVETPVLCVLVVAALLAGFVDAVAGGGGLLQLPLLLRFLAPASAPAVNKASSVCGTTAALVRYARNGNVRWGTLAVAGPVAFAASFAGTLGYLEAVRHAARYVRPVFALCFLALSAYQGWRAFRPPHFDPVARPGVGLAFVGAIGAYDGFVGPGTGMFLFWAFTTWFGLNPLDATGTTKAVNWITNVAALSVFVVAGTIVWPLAGAMASANVLGGWVGAHVAIRRGVRFIRLVTAVVCAAASVYLVAS
jgi:uncharacterized membrane protein YfcA